MVKVIYWLIPIVSLIVSYLIYSKALGSTTNPSVFVSVLLGLIFVIMGNTTCLSWKWITRLESVCPGPYRVKITSFPKPIAGGRGCGSSEGWSASYPELWASILCFLMYWCWSSSLLCLSCMMHSLSIKSEKSLVWKTTRRSSCEPFLFRLFCLFIVSNLKLSEKY